MKQGTGHTSTTAYKTEPKAQAVNVSAVSELGILESRRRKIPIYEGRGFEAPMESQTNHKGGSQGRY